MFSEVRLGILQVKFNPRLQNIDIVSNSLLMSGHYEKIKELIESGMRDFYADQLVSNLSEADGLALFQNDVKALEKLASEGKIEIVMRNVNSRTGQRLTNFVKIKLGDE